MGVSSVVAAALPVPVTQLKLIPVYAAQKGILSVYTSIFCFLILSFIFYTRHSLARLMFPEYADPVTEFKVKTGRIELKSVIRIFITYLPLIFIALSLFCIFEYHQIFNVSIATALIGKDNESQVRLENIPYGTLLMVLYIGVFISTEASFILMAIKEYIQDELGLTEKDLIYGPEYKNRQDTPQQILK